MASGLWTHGLMLWLGKQLKSNWRKQGIQALKDATREGRANSSHDSCSFSYLFLQKILTVFFLQWKWSRLALFSLSREPPKFKTLVYFEIFELFKIESPYNSWQGWQTETVCKSFLPTCTDHFLAATGRAESSDHLVSLCLLLSGFTLSSPARFSLGDTTDRPALNLYFRACHWCMCLSNCDPVRWSNSALDGLLAGSALDGSGTHPHLYLDGRIRRNALT